MTRLLHPHEREAIALQIKDDINEYCRVTYDDGHRSHLGASMIGDICLRRLWYGFRWVQSSKFDGRMQRLFNRGHKEEARWIEWLRGIGIQIWELADDGKQFRIDDVEKHFGGSLDGIGLVSAEAIKRKPIYQLLADVGPFLTEYKTYNRKTFDKLVKDGVRKSKPRHWVQMCSYGRKYGYAYALYCPICKDDDDIHPEIVELDWNVGADAVRKAEHVITSQSAPPRYSELPSHIECKFCDFHAVCHRGAPFEKNCRSCRFAQPVANGEWFCGGYNAIIPKEFIPHGCPAHREVGRNT